MREGREGKREREHERAELSGESLSSLPLPDTNRKAFFLCGSGRRTLSCPRDFRFGGGERWRRMKEMGQSAAGGDDDDDGGDADLRHPKCRPCRRHLCSRRSAAQSPWSLWRGRGGERLSRSQAPVQHAAARSRSRLKQRERGERREERGERKESSQQRALVRTCAGMPACESVTGRREQQQQACCCSRHVELA